MNSYSNGIGCEIKSKCYLLYNIKTYDVDGSHSKFIDIRLSSKITSYLFIMFFYGYDRIFIIINLGITSFIILSNDMVYLVV